MGNGCDSSTKNQDSVIVHSKIKKGSLNDDLVLDKILYDNFRKINLEFCKENFLGPYFLSDGDTLNSINSNTQSPKNNNKKLKNKTPKMIKNPKKEEIFINLLKKSNYNIYAKNKINYKKINSKSPLIDVSIFYQSEYLVQLKVLKIKNSDIFKDMLINGPPSFLRHVIYTHILDDIFNTPTGKSNEEHNLVIKSSSKSIKNENEENNNSAIKIIDQDIPRTFPQIKLLSNPLFSNNLRDILITISQQDKELSYVQGLNFTTSFMLMMTGNNKDLCLKLFFQIMNLKSDLFQMPLKGINLFT